MSHSITARHIVFSQSDDEDSAPYATLYRVDGHITGIPTEESIIAAAEHLSQWDYGDGEGVIQALPPTGPDEERFFVRPQLDDNGWIVYTGEWSLETTTPGPGDYVLTAHSRLGYVSLDRIVTIRKEPTAVNLEWVELTQSDDAAKRDLEVTCLICGERMFDAEAGDTLGVLVRGFTDHLDRIHPTVNFDGLLKWERTK